MEFNCGTAAPFTTKNAINTTGASGFIEFYVQTRDLFATNNCKTSISNALYDYSARLE